MLIMKRLVTSAEMKAIDRRAMSEFGVPGLTLMENAGRAVAAAVEKHFPPVANRRILVICGKGNNGGDGLVTARHLLAMGARVECLLLAPASDLECDVRRNYEALTRTGATIRSVACADEVRPALEHPAVVVDALFGTGLTGAPRGVAAEVIEMVGRRGLPVVSIDIPSGVDSDRGAVFEPAIRSQLTVTMALPKVGLWLYPGRSCTGQVEVADIGIPAGLLAGGDTFLIDADHVRSVLPPRPPAGHKGTFGTALLVAGSRGYSGAACLCAAAAVRSGCGLVRLAVPRGIADIVETRVVEAVKVPLAQTDVETISESALTEVERLLPDCSAVAIGPGIGTHAATRQFLLDLLPKVTRPLVVDADGLNNLVGRVAILPTLRCPVVLTPHPGEFARLAGASPSEVNADRVEAARRFASECATVLVLKGAATVVAAPDGTALINPTGNPGLASGGSGDVLTGLLAGLLAQGVPARDAAAAAVFLHGLAADIAARELTDRCIAAGDLPAYLPRAFRELLQPELARPVAPE